MKNQLEYRPIFYPSLYFSADWSTAWNFQTYFSKFRSVCIKIVKGIRHFSIFPKEWVLCLKKFMGNASIWKKTETLPEHRVLTKDLSVDAAVVGGGLAGILTAYDLAKSGLHVVVLERGCVGDGQTGRTTAKITSQHGLIYHNLLEKFGEEKARGYARANEQAIEEYSRIIKEEKIDCDFTRCPAYLYTTEKAEEAEIKMQQNKSEIADDIIRSESEMSCKNNRISSEKELESENAKLLRLEYEASKKLGISASLVTETELPVPVTLALRFDHQAKFHPLKFLDAISKLLEIYEHTEVLCAEEDKLYTPNGVVTAKNIIFCCHYPFQIAPGYYFMRMHQERSYVIALSSKGEECDRTLSDLLSGMYLGIDLDGLSFRSWHNVLLLGGGGHRTGENRTGGKFARLRQAAEKYYPNLHEVAVWSAQDCITLDNIPYIGQFSASTPNWYVATGFQKWGMTSSMVAAQLIAGLIQNGSHPWEEVFSPQRFSMQASGKKLAKEMLHAAKDLSRRVFAPPRAEVDALPKGHGGVVEYKGEKCGVYKDENGEIFVVSVCCPHLGCQLEWNPDAKSWDCPCHGSRFDYQGKRLDGPAQEGLSEKNE